MALVGNLCALERITGVPQSDLRSAPLLVYLDSRDIDVFCDTLEGVGHGPVLGGPLSQCEVRVGVLGARRWVHVKVHTLLNDSWLLELRQEPCLELCRMQIVA